jgi:hypothetical protein
MDERTTMQFDGVKVFSATKQKDRDELGEVVTRWLTDRCNDIEIVDKVAMQSSDSEYHCITITLFYRHKQR